MGSKMAKQLRKSEQITSSLSICLDYDDKLKKMEEFESAFGEALGDIEIIKYGRERIHPIKYSHNNHDIYFLTAAITWLSEPHPLFKKRMQLKPWFKDFYEEYSNKENSDVKIVGVYRYDNQHIFVEFNAEDYKDNKSNNSSAHVYTNDLYQALINDYFEKIDQNGNKIITIRSENFKKYVNGDLEENDIFKLFDKFNYDFPFGEWIPAVSAISEMKSKNWYQWKGGEWPGWFLEHLVNQFIEKEHSEKTMRYIKNKKMGEIDFDLYFENDNFYGDLKASDINKNDAPGNDQDATLDAIELGKLWYIIYEHETRKDMDYNSEMAIARMELKGTPYHEGDKISYKSRMKHSVNFKKMAIFEVNEINRHLLKVFNQGRNSNGKPRNPKFNIPKRDFDNFIIYSYEPE